MPQAVLSVAALTLNAGICAKDNELCLQAAALKQQAELTFSS